MISLRTYGDASTLPPLVAIPGIDGSIGSVQPIVLKLAERRQVILVDYTAETEATLDDLSAAIAAVLRPRFGGPFDLLGQSIGTILAAQVAAQSVAVRRVVLISTFLRINDLKLRLNNLLAAASPRWLYRLCSRPALEWQCGPVGDGRHHPFFAMSAESDPQSIVKRTAWEIGRDFHSDIGRIAQPLLVLMGAKDRFVPNAGREIEELKRLLAGRAAQVVTVPEAGHVLLPTAAIDFAVSRITEFLA